MKEKKPDIKIDIKAVFTDNETGEVIAPKEKPISLFYKIPWGWICIAFIVLFVLNVKYGRLILGLSMYETVGNITVWGTFFSFVFFIWKLMDKDDREGGHGGCGYSCLGS